MSARKIESAATRFPAQRARIKTTKKEHFTSCGEATTFQGTYSGVCYRSLGELPLIDAAAKAKILAACPGAPAAPAVTAVPDPWKDNHGEDVPLFWQEAKPISFYLALIDDMQVKAVFDMTAGSGALMEAALTRGIQYHGVCFNRDHMTWLQAIADRAACVTLTSLRRLSRTTSQTCSALWSQAKTRQKRRSLWSQTAGMMPANPNECLPILTFHSFQQLG